MSENYKQKYLKYKKKYFNLKYLVGGILTKKLDLVERKRISDLSEIQLNLDPEYKKLILNIEREKLVFKRENAVLDDLLLNEYNLKDVLALRLEQLADANKVIAYHEDPNTKNPIYNEIEKGKGAKQWAQVRIDKITKELPIIEESIKLTRERRNAAWVTIEGLEEKQREFKKLAMAKIKEQELKDKALRDEALKKEKELKKSILEKQYSEYQVNVLKEEELARKN